MVASGIPGNGLDQFSVSRLVRGLSLYSHLSVTSRYPQNNSSA